MIEVIPMGLFKLFMITIKLIGFLNICNFVIFKILRFVSSMGVVEVTVRLCC